MRVLVTGVGGFIGSHLAKELIKKGHFVRGLFLPHEETQALEDIGVEVFRGDLCKPLSIKGITKDIDTVFHLAARTLDWGTMQQFKTIMVDGTENLLKESGKNVRKFVYFSSVAALGLNRDIKGFKEDAKRVITKIPYCDTKIMAEDLVNDYCTKNSLPFTIIRPVNVIGPGSIWIKEVLDTFLKMPVPLINGGNNPGAFIYIDNLIHGTLLAAESDKSNGKTYHFCDHYSITWKEYLQTVGSWIGKKTFGSVPFRLAWSLGWFFEKIFIPFGIRPPVTRLASGIMGKNLDVDTSLAEKDLGWTTLVPEEEAMNSLKLWVKQEYKEFVNLLEG